MLIRLLGILNTLAIGKLTLPLEILIDFAFFFLWGMDVSRRSAGREGRALWPPGVPAAVAGPGLRLLRGGGRGARAAGPRHSCLCQGPPRRFLQARIGFLPGV